MSEIFEVTETDKREEFLATIEEGKKTYRTQTPFGGDVKYFSPETGFVLLRQIKDMNLNTKSMLRALVCAKLSLGPSLELREFYYTLRGQPDLVKPFSAAVDIYSAVLDSIKVMEVVCDIGRHNFTVGNLPKGFIHYGHSSTYGNMEEPIGFTENIARRVLPESEVSYALNIIHMEKGAAATRLVSMGFSELTNGIISTTGGNFTRAVYALANRFKDSKEIIFFTDGDAFGQDMLRAVQFGTEASRHLTPQQAFPVESNPSIHLAGLFPSVAESLGIPNDVEQKRPMNNPFVKKRVEFMKRYNLVDQRDIDTWERNRTYELEALSTRFRNKNDEPVGLGIYLAEYMRLNEIPCKPTPTDDDEDIKSEFEEEARSSIQGKVRWHARRESPAATLKSYIEEKVNEIVDGIVDEIMEEVEDEIVDLLDEITAEAIRSNLMMQYQKNPRREIYSLDDLANRVSSVSVDVNWNSEELIKRVKETIDSYIKELRESGELFTHKVELDPIGDVTDELRDFYDIVLEQIGANPKDARVVRQALTERLA